MKNTIKVLGIIAVIAIIGFSVVACSDNSGGNNGGNTGGNNTGSGKQLSGTYYNGLESVAFSGNNFTYYALGIEGARGTYTVNGNVVTGILTWVISDPVITVHGKVGDVWTITIINDTTLRDEQGTWTKR